MAALLGSVPLNTRSRDSGGEESRETSKGEGVYRHGAQQSVSEGSGYKGAPRLIVLLGKRLEDLLILWADRQTETWVGL